MKRPLNQSEDNRFSFYIFNSIDKHNATFEVSRYGKEQDFYVLKFHRPGLKQPHLYTFYVLDSENKCIYSVKLEDGEPGETVSLMDRSYKVYETYTLGQDTETTHSIYFQINTESKTISVDMSLRWLPKHVVGFVRNVRFFPYDVDPTQYGLKLNTTQIIQKTPLWFKARGEVSGTKAYQLIGYWVPSKKEDPNWSIDGDHVFDAQSKANMRFGSESEDKGLITYTLYYSGVISKIELAGWCNAPQSSGLATGWGASPDALVCEPNHTWDDERIPESTKTHFGGEGGVGGGVFNPTLGVLEIKSSQTKLSFEPYFFPQLYMEMISTQRVWCDLVRYTPHTTRVYRVYRHKPTEDTLISLWKYARKNAHKLRDIIQEEPFVKIRNYFKKLASTLSFIEIETPTPQIVPYESYQKERRQNSDSDSAVFDTSFLTKRQNTTWFQEADNNHKAFYGAVNNPEKLKQLILKQMDLYTQVLKAM